MQPCGICGARLNLITIQFNLCYSSLRGIADIVKLHAVLCAIALADCATFHIEPANQPLPTPVSNLVENDRGLSGDDRELFVGLAFSGGGMRAAAFSYGILAEFDRTQIPSKNSTTRLIDHVDFLSGVSGGAIAAAYFGLNGRAGLANFHEQFLMRDAEESFSSILNPMSVAHAYEGGINGSQQFPRWLDDNLFHGATFRQLGPERRPRVWINASDIFNRTPFVFSDETFGAICSDLASYPIANAVAASAAMPVIFAPVVLRTFPDRCSSTMPNWIVRARREATASPILKAYANAITRYRDGSMSYIKLLDGGLVDNYGLSGFTIARLLANAPYAPLTARQAAKYAASCFSSSMEARVLLEIGQRLQKVPQLPRSSWPPLIRRSIRVSAQAIRPSIARCPSGAMHWFVGDALYRRRNCVNMAHPTDRVAET